MGRLQPWTPDAEALGMVLPSVTERLSRYRESDVDETISPHDNMFEADRREHYFAAGRDAVAVIALAMLKIGTDRFDNVLDLPCGSGRVMRHLARFLPEASMVASDIDPAHVDFCARQFGADPLLSRHDLRQVEPERPIDLLWCGSLLTHFPADRFTAALHQMVGWLAPGGVGVFTLHGRWSLRRQSDTPHRYLDDESFVPIAEGVARDGFGYAEYPNHRGGLSVSLPPWVMRTIDVIDDVRLLDYTERGWDNHQDVLTVWKIPIAARPWMFEDRLD